MSASALFIFPTSAIEKPKFSRNCGGPLGQLRLNTTSHPPPITWTCAGRWSFGYTTTRQAPILANVGIVADNLTGLGFELFLYAPLLLHVRLLLGKRNLLP